LDEGGGICWPTAHHGVSQTSCQVYFSVKRLYKILQFTHTHKETDALLIIF